MNIVTLYTKEGCHLCDVARGVIESVAKRREFELVVRDILDNQADYDLYKHDVPVVAVNGVELGRHRIGEAELERALGFGQGHW